MTLKEQLAKFFADVKAELTDIAKTLVEKDLDGATDKLTKFADGLEAKAEEITKDVEEVTPEGEATPPAEGDGEGEGEPTDVEKAVAEAMKKYADMYISADDVKTLLKDLMDAFMADINKAHTEAIDDVKSEISKVAEAVPGSKQIVKTEGAEGSLYGNILG